jgi:hypothetical protein
MPLRFLGFTKHSFHVNHERSVDGFDGADPQPVPGDVAYVDAMMAKRICPGGP